MDARRALYTEASQLNLEVPDLFSEGGDWFLLYSDQRDKSWQVRYLTATDSTGPHAYGPYDALDGRAFYAGKSAGMGKERLLFGWVAHKGLRKDAMSFVWAATSSPMRCGVPMTARWPSACPAALPASSIPHGPN